MRHEDERLPEGITVWENIHKEFVAVKDHAVVFFDREMVKAGDSVEQAVYNYLNKVIYK